MNALVKIFKKASSISDPKPQLRMFFPSFLNPPDYTMLPKGFKSRQYRNNDLHNWLNLMNQNNQLGKWNRQRIESILIGQSFSTGQQFVFVKENLVACAGAYFRSQNQTKLWEIGWIATNPKYFGIGLGSHVIIRAIHFARFQTNYPIFLLTDDFRIPAISLYLKIGFLPSNLDDEEILVRWEEIKQKIKSPESEILKAYIEDQID